MILPGFSVGSVGEILKPLALWRCAVPAALVRQLGTPKFILMFSATARAQDWRGA